MRILSFVIKNNVTKEKTYNLIVDGKILKSFVNEKLFQIEVNNNDHIVVIETSDNTKSYLLHVPVGNDNYDFEVKISEKVIEIY